MEIIPKVGILIGIVALIIMMPFLVLTQISYLSHEFGSLFVDQDAVLEEFKQFESYTLFTEKYPDFYEKDWKDRSGSVNLEVYAYNFNTGNRLELDLRYDAYDDRIRENIRCRIEDNSLRQGLGFSSFSSADEMSSSLPRIFLEEGRAEDEFTVDFIKYTNCLEIGDEKSTKQTSMPNENSPKPHYISLPEGTSSPGCENTNECFTPYSQRISIGDVISWRNFDQAAHTVTSGTPDGGPDGIFDSGLFLAGKSFEVAFDAAGTYSYFCMVHPWMVAEIVVTDLESMENE